MSSPLLAIAYGQKIAIKFTKDLLGDPTGRNHPPVGGYELIKLVPSIPGRVFPLFSQVFSASDTYGSVNTPDKAFDGSTGTYWQTRAALPQWIQADLGEGNAWAMTRCRYYSGASYRIRAFVLAGSNNLTDWDTLLSEENAASTGWRQYDFENETAYRYYRWTINSRWTAGRIYVYELELYGNVPIGNEIAFTVSGQQPNPVHGGALEYTEYVVGRVERYTATDDTLLLSFDGWNKFNNVDGNLTVAYSQAVGNLTETNPVEDFSEELIPLSLEPDPLNQHTITVEGTELDVDFIYVTYHEGYTPHTIEVAGTEVFIDFINVEDIPP